MIVETVLGNVADMSVGQRRIERVHLASADLLKRLHRVRTEAGREVGIRLKHGVELKEGDVLWMDDEVVIVIDVLPEELLVILPRSMREMGELAHQLGNRHVPVQFDGETMLVQYDYLIENLLVEQGVPYRLEIRKVGEPFRQVGHHAK